MGTAACGSGAGAGGGGAVAEAFDWLCELFLVVWAFWLLVPRSWLLTADPCPREAGGEVPGGWPDA